MSELRLYLRRDSLRDGNECAWVLRGDDDRVAGAGSGLDKLPRARRCHLVLAADLVNLVPASLPNLPIHKLQGLLPGAAEAHALSEAEQLHVAWLGLDPHGTSWLAVVDKAWLTASLNALKARGLVIAAVLPESLLLPVGSDAWSVLRHEDGAVIRQGPWQGHAVDAGDPPASLNLAGPLPGRLDVYQGSALHPVDVAGWQAVLGLPVHDLGTWSWREAGWPAGPDLLQGTLAPRRGRPDWQALARSLASGLALLVLIQVVGLAVDWGLLAREEDRLRSELHGLAERALPAHASIVDPAWQVAERLRAMQAAEGGIESGFLVLLSRVGSTWPAGMGAPRQVEYRDGTAILHFDAATPAAGLEEFKAGLSKAGLVVAATPGADGQALSVREGGVPAGTGGRHGN
ncbi:MAG: type II secretion system protein GspL [Gallionellaceae bacterium]|nr:type II secretion system protein GspL [Gallionellaceae bacterium]